MDRATLKEPATPDGVSGAPAAVRHRDLVAIAWQRVTGRGRPLPITFNVMAHLQFVADLVRVRFRWQPQNGAGYLTRVYRDYAEYLRHQKGKLPRIDLTEYDRVYREALRTRLESLPLQIPGARVLCLGARIGTEVKAFLDLRAFAIGVDLNPGPSNRYVVHGDFHDLQYADESADVVFSNSVDHVFDMTRWMTEVRRVLRPGGILLLEVGLGIREGGHPEFYESLCWSSVQDLSEEIQRHGFQLTHTHPFTGATQGTQLMLQRI